MFVISTSSSAGGLPLGVVVTSGEKVLLYIIISAMNQLLSKGNFYGKGSLDKHSICRVGTCGSTH